MLLLFILYQEGYCVSSNFSLIFIITTSGFLKYLIIVEKLFILLYKLIVPVLLSDTISKLLKRE